MFIRYIISVSCKTGVKFHRYDSSLTRSTIKLRFSTQESSGWGLGKKVRVGVGWCRKFFPGRKGG